MKEIGIYSLVGFPDLFCSHSPAPLPFFLHSSSRSGFCLSFPFTLSSVASIKLYPPDLSHHCQETKQKTKPTKQTKILVCLF